MNDNKYKRGSVWRKWDLHVHAPSKYTCAKKDDYEGSSLEEKFNNFIDELKSLEDVSVVGITDYFSINGYEEVIKHKNDLENIDLILPNIEFRITPVTGNNRKINLHIIANTEVLSTDEIKDFLYEFKFSSNRFTCREADLISLGKKDDASKSNEQAFNDGLNKFVISYDKFFEVFNKQTDKFKENVLIGVSNSSTDGASGIKDVSGIREIIYEGVNFIFSSNSSDYKYFLGEGVDSKEKVIEKYGDLMPCVHGSDYHGNRNGAVICQPDLNRFCWIKADPTFEGLKQIIYEPKERVKIQEENPLDVKKHWTLNKLIIKNSDIDIFPDQEILFNPYLTSIIGGRATGKSALVKLISFINGNNDKFIDYIRGKNIDIALKFIDSDNNEQEFLINNFEDKNEALPIYYLSQEDIEKFSDENKKDVHKKTFLETIGIDNTSHYYNREQQEIESCINELKDIDKYEDDFEKYVNELANNRKITFHEESSCEDKAGAIVNNLKREKDKYSTEATKNAIDEISARVTLANKIKAIQESDETQKIKIKAQEINNLIQKYNKNINNNCFINDNYIKKKKNLPVYDMGEITTTIESNNTALENYLEELRSESMPYIKILKDAGIDYKTIKQSIESIDKTILYLETKKQEFETNKTKKEEVLKKIIEVFNSYEDSIVISENDIQNKFEEFTSDRGELFEEIFEGINVTHQRYLSKNKFKNKFKSYFYSGKEINFREFFDDLQSANYFQKFNVDFLNKVIKKKDNFKENTGGYYSIINLVYSDFIDNYLQIRPKIEFEGRELGSMSGGQQATLMLKLKLASEGIKKDLIILDQPENHLDNKFINKHLVDLIKLLKRYKQVVMVSHNANVVVLSDSEEVIVAKMDDVSDKKYISGSMENHLINEEIVEVLEGGKTAFEQRKKKYNF